MAKQIAYNLLLNSYSLYFNSLSQVAPKKAIQKAFDLFSTPRKGKTLPFQQEFLEAALDQQLPVNDMKVQCYRWPGKGKTVLLLHGWESNTFRWRNLIAFLKEADYNIVALDGPAHGNTKGSTIFNAVLYEQCVQAAIEAYLPHYLVGHSIGGFTAIYSQYRKPHDNISKIVTLGAPSRMKGIFDNYIKLLRLNPKIESGLKTYIQEKYGVSLHEFAAENFVPELSQTGLLVHDRFDTVVPFSASERMHQEWAGSVLMATEGLGHSVHQDEVNKKIIEFLND